MAAQFQLVSDYSPAGDQPQAIAQILDGFQQQKKRFQVLLGATGTGKTFTAANIIAALNKPTLVLAHNKTLAAQLYKEFKGFFPHNAVCYFVSYYDYYQPEAYIPQRDIYIEKDSSINQNIDRLRLSATGALVSREDVIIVASVSCIYGLGSPSDYKRMMIFLTHGETIARETLLLKLVDVQYQRNDVAFERGRFRVRGDTIEVWPASEEYALRIELFGDTVDGLAVINPISGETIRTLNELYVYPAKHFVTPEERTRVAIEGIEQELNARLEQFKNEGKLLEAERLKARTRYDLDMLREVGYCSGVENYRAGSAVEMSASLLIPSSTSSPKIFSASWMNLMFRCRRCAACTPGMRAESKHLSNTVFVCPALWIIARFALKNGNPISSRCCVYRPRPAQRNWNEPAARLSNKSSGPPGWSIPSSTFARHAARCPIWSKKSTCAQAQRTRSRHHADQADVGRPDQLFPRSRAALQMVALGTRCHRTGASAPRASRRRLRCIGRREPVARRPRFAGSIPGGGSGCRQGRVLAQ